MNAVELSVVVPFSKRGRFVAELYRRIAAASAEIDGEAEFLFIDDASTDGGQLELLSAARADPRLRVLALSPHAGQSAALEAGCRAARGRWIATLDADLQNDPADLPKLLAARRGFDCVNGVRMGRQDSAGKRWASRIANGFRRLVLGDEVTDIGCSLRVMRADRLARIRFFRGAHRFLPILLTLDGARLVEVPVRHHARKHGQSKYAIWDRFGVGLIDLLAVVWLKRRAHRYEAKELNRLE